MIVSYFLARAPWTSRVEAWLFLLIFTNYSALQSAESKKFAALAFPRCANQRFHVIEVALERFTTCRREAVFRLGQSTVERLRAHDVIGFFELSRMDAQVAVGRLQHRFQFIECERAIHSKRADDAQPHAFV